MRANRFYAAGESSRSPIKTALNGLSAGTVGAACIAEGRQSRFLENSHPETCWSLHDIYPDIWIFGVRAKIRISSTLGPRHLSGLTVAKVGFCGYRTIALRNLQRPPATRPHSFMLLALPPTAVIPGCSDSRLLPLMTGHSRAGRLSRQVAAHARVGSATHVPTGNSSLRR